MAGLRRDPGISHNIGSAQTSDTKQESKQHERTHKTHLPFWLGRNALILFLLIFVGCAASLIGLNHFISSRDGIPLTISSSSYSWTYGPTAILVVILSLWRRVDYFYKSAQPWRELWKGPALAEKSILLDYISPIQAMSALTAWKHRHYAVVATIVSFLLLKFVILISTTLFVLVPSFHLEPSDITYSNAFQAAKAWDSGGYFPSPGFAYMNADRSLLAGGSSASVWTYLASLTDGTTGESRFRPPGNMVTQQFAPMVTGSNLTLLEAPIDVFVPKVTCEDAVLSSTPLDSGLVGEANDNRTQVFNFVSPTCSSGGGWENPCSARHGVTTPSDVYRTCESQPRSYIIHRLNCTDPFNATNYVGDERHWPQDIESYDIRYAIAATHFEAKIDPPDSRVVQSMNVINSSAIICKINYGIASVNATYNLFTNEVIFKEDVQQAATRLLSNLSSIAVAEMTMDNLAVAAQSLVVSEKLPTKKPQTSTPPNAPDALFQLMYSKLGSPADIDVFYQGHVLKNTTIAAFEGLLTEFSRQSMIVDAATQASATGTVSVRKLYMRSASLWIMVAVFLLLVVLCLLLAVTARRSLWLSAMSGSMAGQAAVLANSLSLQALLKDSGHCREKDLKQKLKSSQITAIADPDRGVVLEAQQVTSLSSEVPHAGPSQRKMHEWSPLFGRLPVFILTLVLPLFCIGTLELLYQLSSKNQGLVNIDNSGSSALLYIIRIASTLVVFGIATIFNSLDFTIATFAPYSNLHSGSVRADRSILFNLLAISPFLVLIKCLRHRQFGAAASNISSLLAGFLTIIVSGLWVLTDSKVAGPATASVRNWDISWLNDSSNDGGAGVLLNIIRHGSLLNPNKIWQDVVLPEVTLLSDDGAGLSGLSDANYTFSVVSLEPLLNCTQVPQQHIVVEITSHREEVGQMGNFINVQDTRISVHPPNIPIECSERVALGSANLTYDTTINTLGSRWIGQYFDLYNTTAGRVSTACPSVGIVFGQVEGVNAAARNLTALLCTQEIKEIDNLILAVGQKYGEYMRHVINLNFRAGSESVDGDLVSAAGELSSSSTTTLSPTVTISGASSREVNRLAIDKTSKLILQILLAAMAILGLIGYTSTKMSGLLPRNPCSIASTMGFLADSQLCDRGSGIIPQGSELRSDHELGELFDGWVFSLGWWNTGNTVDSAVATAQPHDNPQGTHPDAKLMMTSVSAQRRGANRFGVDVGRAMGYRED
ncbi:unnamed protein product [Clonostachys byssicola]|uniref:Uncharacterized protein n=1 Tax=Clonostachys byssicola TaxID=160290 RepID=A0A9N9XZN3_9HYPO|nr:unnamed protein product [Clonostachys byssicola]